MFFVQRFIGAQCIVSSAAKLKRVIVTLSALNALNAAQLRAKQRRVDVVGCIGFDVDGIVSLCFFVV